MTKPAGEAELAAMVKAATHAVAAKVVKNLSEDVCEAVWDAANDAHAAGIGDAFGVQRIIQQRVRSVMARRSAELYRQANDLYKSVYGVDYTDLSPGALSYEDANSSTQSDK